MDNSVFQRATCLFPVDGIACRVFCDPVEVVVAHTVEEVLPALAQLDAAVLEAGMFVAGFMAYEAAAAFDEALKTHESPGVPLLWFAVFDGCEMHGWPPSDVGAFEVGEWASKISRNEYETAITAIRAHIERGDTYQVNYTFPLTASFEGDALAWFATLCQAQGAGHYGYVDTGEHVILSASPELFFSLDGTTVTTQPMKGTRPRGLWRAQDLAMAEALQDSEKDRAENIMIVDMLRNDLGRICETRSVSVTSRYDLKRYETVWQMTSTITGETSASVPEILRALFPCGSVTGAPKVETMKIIRDVEQFPRGVYCGAVGWWGPGREAEFCVPIRTVTLARETHEASYHIGSGITWDSSTALEYEECFSKAAVLSYARPTFDLLETMLFENEYFLLDEHLARLAQSAAYFDYPCDFHALRIDLQFLGRKLGAVPHMVRVRVLSTGDIRIEESPLPPKRRLRIGLAREAIQTENVFLYHKTTHRVVYASACASRPECDEVMLHNERGELADGTIGNIVLDIGGRKVTPKLESGVLAGTFRSALLASGEVVEGTLKVEDLQTASSIHLLNSVRKWIDVEFVP